MLKCPNYNLIELFTQCIIFILNTFDKLLYDY